MFSIMEKKTEVCGAPNAVLGSQHNTHQGRGGHVEVRRQIIVLIDQFIVLFGIYTRSYITTIVQVQRALPRITPESP